MPEEKRIYRLRTSQGEYYEITEAGNIIRMDQTNFQPSDKWKLRGLANNRGHLIIPFDAIAEWMRRGKPGIKLVNRSPRYFIADFDHGTDRVWGKGNGLSDIWAI